MFFWKSGMSDSLHLLHYIAKLFRISKYTGIIKLVIIIRLLVITANDCHF